MNFKLDHFKQVDGLRALAVISVIAYHVNASLPAGFVGVDVFFVISGFVVTMASTNLPNRTISSFAAAFYARRLLRITPALVVCLLVTSILSALFIPQAWLSDANFKTGLAAFFGLSNYALALNSEKYWAPRSDFNPYTHTWSLGVEEQFYVLFPLLFLASIHFRRTRVTALIFLLSTASIAAAALGAQHTDGQAISFYSIHTRFWELAAGVLLFLTINHWRPWLSQRSVHALNTAASIGFAGLIASFTLISPAAFPWPQAIFPVGATLLTIMAIVSGPDTLIAKGLASPPVAYVGRISYSLYLWHWPILVLARWTFGLQTNMSQAICVTLTIMLAALSFHAWEEPIRRSTRISTWPRGRVALLGIALITASASVSTLINFKRAELSLSVTRDEAVWNPHKFLIPPQARCKLERHTSTLFGGTKIDLSPKDCEASGSRLYVAGDSHAYAYAQLLGNIVQTTGISVSVISLPGCSVLGMRFAISNLQRDCAVFTRKLLKHIASESKLGDVLFLPSLRMARLSDQWGGTSRPTQTLSAEKEFIIDEATALLKPVSEAGVGIVFEAPKPVFGVALFRCSDWFNQSNADCKAPRKLSRTEFESLRLPPLENMRAVIAKLPRALIWDPAAVLCSAVSCDVQEKGMPLFFDGDHLSGHGNQVLVNNFLKMLTSEMKLHHGNEI